MLPPCRAAIGSRDLPGAIVRLRGRRGFPTYVQMRGSQARQCVRHAVHIGGVNHWAMTRSVLSLRPALDCKPCVRRGKSGRRGLESGLWRLLDFATFSPAAPQLLVGERQGTDLCA